MFDDLRVLAGVITLLAVVLSIVFVLQKPKTKPVPTIDPKTTISTQATHIEHSSHLASNTITGNQPNSDKSLPHPASKPGLIAQPTMAANLAYATSVASNNMHTSDFCDTMSNANDSSRVEAAESIASDVESFSGSETSLPVDIEPRHAQVIYIFMHSICIL